MPSSSLYFLLLQYHPPHRSTLFPYTTLFRSRVEAHLEETKLRHIRVGAQARIRLMGDDRDIAGHVDSIAGGIADDQRSNSANLLPTVTATFTWVRLAQRIPVRIHIHQMPPGTRLILGRTATVTIIPSDTKDSLPRKTRP